MYSSGNGVRRGEICAAIMLFLACVGTAAAGPVNISGTPPASVIAGQAYAFQPSSSAAGNRTLSFSIANKPAWAAFSIATGKLTGVPQTTQVGTYSNIIISATDGNRTAQLSAFSIQVRAPLVVNGVPTIGGIPLTQVKADTAYFFKPTAADPDGNTLTFGISNRPAWASFNTATGALSGTPTAAQVGSYGSIVISVSDGHGGSATLPAFAISVVQSASGSVSLSWLPPTQNSDGSALTDLAGYRVAYGTAAGGPYAANVSIANPSVSTYLVENLTPGTYYFVVTARNTSGVESAFSGQVSKTVN